MNFWQRVFSDGGQPSFSRIATGLIVAFSCGWVTKLVWHNYSLPDFAGLALFIGTLYGINKAGNAFSKPQEQPKP